MHPNVYCVSFFMYSHQPTKKKVLFDFYAKMFAFNLFRKKRTNVDCAKELKGWEYDIRFPKKNKCTSLRYYVKNCQVK